MKRIRLNLLSVLAVLALLFSSIPAFATDGVVQIEGYPEDYLMVNGKTPDQIDATITMWTWDPNFFTMAEKVSAYYPNIKWNFVNVSGDDYLLKLTTALSSGGEVPDLICMEIQQVAKFYTMDILEDVAASPWNIDKNLLVPYLADIGTTPEGMFTSIPNTAAPGGIYYRRDLAKEYFGTDDPEVIGQRMSTWDGFIEMGQELKEKSDGKVSMLAGLDSNITAWVNQNPLPWVDGNKLLISENYLDTFKLIERLRDAKIDAGLDDGTPAYYASYSQGNVFCYFGATWTETFVVAPNDPNGAGNWAVCRNPGAPYNWGGIWWGMYKGSKPEVKEAVAAWMKYELTPLGAQNKYELIHFYPGLQSSYTSDYLYKPNEFLGGELVANYYLDVMQKMKMPPLEPETATFMDTIGFYCRALVKDQGSAEELLDQAESDLISKVPTFTK